jgi:rare lipoprotein A
VTELLARLLLLVAHLLCGPAEPAPPQRGLATWYGGAHHGRRTASGQVFDQDGLTAAHRSLPFGTVVDVRHLRSGRTVRLRVNDRGPFGGRGRIIDVSRRAATELGMRSEGVAPVDVFVVGAHQRRCRGARGR